MWDEVESFVSIHEYHEFELKLAREIQLGKAVIIWWKDNESCVSSIWPIDQIVIMRLPQKEYWCLFKPDPPSRGSFKLKGSTAPWVME